MGRTELSLQVLVLMATGVVVTRKEVWTGSDGEKAGVFTGNTVMLGKAGRVTREKR